jgi:hypothetical protein
MLGVDSLARPENKPFGLNGFRPHQNLQICRYSEISH